MDNLFIEINSINKLEETLMRTERIQPNIEKNDKIPSWDGEIIVYKSKDINKSNILGNIRVQVKGTQKDDLSLSKIKYNVNVDDLKNYMNDGGCIFFVIYMKDFDEFKIYYRMLLPYDLKLIMNSAKENQKSKSIDLEEYPKSDIELQMEIYKSFVYDRKLQISTVDASFRINEIDSEILKQIDNISVTLPQTGKDFEKMFDLAFKIPSYIYANTMKSNISIPIEKVKLAAMTFPNFEAKVCLNGKCYFNSIKIIKKQDDELIVFGRAFCFSPKDGKLYFQLRGTLNERIKDLNFFLVLRKSKEKIITIDKYCKAELNELDLCRDIKSDENTLKYMVMILSALKFVGVKKELECDNLTDIDQYNIMILINSICCGKPLCSDEYENGIKKLKISNIIIPIIIKQLQGNLWAIRSLFNEKNVNITNNFGLEINAFLFMNKEDFLEISNIDYDFMKTEIMNSKYPKEIKGDIVTKFISEALLAYDEKKDEQLIDFILEISKWQIDNDNNNITYLNMFQIIKRKRDFNEEEIEKLNFIKSNCTQDYIKLAVCILMESKIEMSNCWKNLDEEMKHIFKNYPIYNLVEKDELK